MLNIRAHRPSPAATVFLVLAAAFQLHGQTTQTHVVDNPFIADKEGASTSSGDTLIAKSKDFDGWTKTPADTAPNQNVESQESQALTSEGVTSRVPSRSLKHLKRPDFNRDIYYRNKLELSLESGYLPYNIPFVFDILVNSPYTQWPLHYTLVPTLASLRWHVDGIHGPSVLRGNTDFTFSGSFTAIPRGSETRYEAFEFGIRRNFVQRGWRAVPYFDARGGVGYIDARGPQGVLYAQGQDLTFTLKMSSGGRYNFNPRYSLSAGVMYMHVSNLYLSEPRYENFGINVYGPTVGFNMRLGKSKPAVVQ